MENDFHPNCFACGSNNGAGLRLKFHKQEDGSVLGYFFSDPRFEGYPGMVHGGIIATLLDSAMTHCLLRNRVPALTGRLSIRYSLPIRTGMVIKLEARVVNQSHGVFMLEGKALVEGKKMASAEARYMLSDEFNHFPETIPGIEDVPLVKNHSFEHKLIGDIIKEYPETSEVMKKYFGEECLERPSFKIKTLEAACILFGVDQNCLIQDFEKIQN